MSSPTLSQKLTAEAIGTAILVFIGAGSVPLTVLMSGGPGSSIGSAGLSTISFAFAFAIFAAVYSVGHISGCHINPAVTIALLATRKIDARTAGTYIVAQVIGATIGAALTYVILIGKDPVALGLGAVSFDAATSGIAIALAAEIIGTAILVFTVFGAAVDGRAPAGFAGIIIGFIVYGVIILVGPITGAALNPARQFGPNLVEQVIGKSTNWDQLVVYIVGPIVGGLVGAFLYQFVGHHRTATVPGAAVPEGAHAEA
jgi:glycerol uptake facilitator protein